MRKQPKKKRKPYKTTNRFGLKLKTTTKEGKREYMRLYMRARKMDLANILGIKQQKRRK